MDFVSACKHLLLLKERMYAVILLSHYITWWRQCLSWRTQSTFTIIQSFTRI